MSVAVGIIGGMGPAATIDFMARLLAATPARGDVDHLRLLVDCNPHVPDRNRALTGVGPSPAPVLADMARGLVAQGAGLLAMPCNAAHAFAGAIRDAVPVPLVSIIDTTVAEIGRRGMHGAPIGLLAADATLAAGLYQTRLPDAIVPGVGEQAALMALIYRIKAGDRDVAIREGMVAIVAHLAARGARAIVAACTEVPLVLGQADVNVPLIDATDTLVQAVVSRARHQARYGADAC